MAAVPAAVALPPPKVVVLTGASGVGKTSLIQRLADLGYHTVPEAAMQCINVLNTLLDDGFSGGPQKQLDWRVKHKEAFADLVGTVQMNQEACQHAGRGPVFLDRSILDNLGYSKARGYQPPSYLTAEVARQHSMRSDRVFVLEPVANEKALAARN
jgi:predicted ATPase